MRYIMPYSTIFKHKEDLDLNSYSTISYATLVLSCLIIFYAIVPGSKRWLEAKIKWETRCKQVAMNNNGIC